MTNLEQAKALIEQESKTRSDKAQKDIEQTLKENDCDMVPIIEIDGQKINLSMLLNAKIGFLIIAKPK